MVKARAKVRASEKEGVFFFPYYLWVVTAI
jgi:hypothetical protein